jgi:hypothetical protein
MNEPLPPQQATEQAAESAGLEYVAGPAEAGDAACWAQFVCPECGAVRGDSTCTCDPGRSGPGSQPGIDAGFG